MGGGGAGVQASASVINLPPSLTVGHAGEGERHKARDGELHGESSQKTMRESGVEGPGEASGGTRPHRGVLQTWYWRR